MEIWGIYLKQQQWVKGSLILDFRTSYKPPVFKRVSIVLV